MSGKGNTRRQGDLIEAKFVVKALEKGLKVSKPLSDTLAYDFIVDYKGELSRIQVKSTSKELGIGRWRLLVARGAKVKKTYSAKDIDFFAIFLLPLDLWYLIPVEEIDGLYVQLYPEKPNKDKLGKFKENWKLIKPPRKYIVSKAPRKKIIGGVYKTKYGYQVRYGRDITKHFPNKEDAEACLQEFRDFQNQDDLSSV